MKKTMSILTVALLVLALLAGCGGLTTQTTTTPAPAANENTPAPANNETPASEPAQPHEPAETEEPPKSADGYAPFVDVQGVTDDAIYVGNTAATTGAFATVGVPFNAGMEAAFKAYNDAGGFDGKAVKLVHYDDGFDGAQGLAYTQTLVEEDHVFAIVGNFGTNTVGANLDYLKEKGVPMVYAATGIEALYQEGATGNAKVVYPVQPIYNAEGRVLLARALADKDSGMGLGGTKVGVIATTDDAGAGLLYGVKRQAQDLNPDIVYQEVDTAATDYSAAVNVLMNAGCDVLIACMNQAPLATLMASMRDAGYDVDVVTSYVNASVATLGAFVDNGSITENRHVYSTAWMDTSTEEGMADYLDFAAVMSAWELENGFSGSEYVLNSYAMAGYVAGGMFVQALTALHDQGLALDWYSFNDVMGETVFKVPMGGTIHYHNGDRLGITSLAFNTIQINEDGSYAMATVAPIDTLENVLAAIK